MRKTIAVLVGLLLCGVAQAGGRAKVTVVSAPRQVMAGQSFRLAFVVKPEVLIRHRNLEPVVVVSQGDQTMTIPAIAAGKDRFAATIALPASGEWQLRVDSRYCHTVMDPLTVRAVSRPS